MQNMTLNQLGESAQVEGYLYKKEIPVDLFSRTEPNSISTRRSYKYLIY